MYLIFTLLAALLSASALATILDSILDSILYDTNLSIIYYFSAVVSALALILIAITAVEDVYTMMYKDGAL